MVAIRVCIYMHLEATNIYPIETDQARDTYISFQMMSLEDLVRY
jgi:hypothetical protein